MKDTKINIQDDKVYQLTGDTLTLSGNTYISNINYLKDNSLNYNKRSLPDVNYLTGKTTNLLNKINIISGTTGYLSAGVIGTFDPVLTDNNNGTATINDIDVLLYKTTDYNGYLYYYHITGGTFTFTDNTEEYIAVNYNNGSPILYKETNINNINNSNIILIFICWRQGNKIYSLNFDRIGLGLSNKLQISEYDKFIYTRSNDGGLIITESTIPSNRTVIVSSAKIYTGAIIQNILSFNSSGDTLTEVTVTNGTWTYNNVSVYNNINYNPPTGPVAMTDNKYGIVWFYRAIGNLKQVFYVLGNSQYNNLADAELSIERTDLPVLLKKHCILIGRSIILKNAATGNIESAFNKVFLSSQVIDHNSTGNKQGGNLISNQYYHLDLNIFNNVTGGTSNFQQQLNNKLNTTLFNTFTGTTLPNNYYNKTQINTYTGNTNNKINYISGVTNTKLSAVPNAIENNVVVFNNIGSIKDSGINKALIYAGLVM